MSTYKGWIAKSAVFLLLVGLLFAYTPASADINSAVTYLQSKDASPWVTMALKAAGQSVDVEYLKSSTCSKAIDCATPIMALTAAGKDPRTFGSTDLVAQLKGYHASNQIGDTATVNDDIFGVIALLSAGVATSDLVVQDAKTFILNNQNVDGGWGFSVGGSSDTNMTAAAIMALVELGVSKSDSAITNAKAYLQSAQNDDGGFPYDPVSPYGTDSDSSSDAWVISAIYALGEQPTSWTKNGNDPLTHMLSLQDASGYFHFQPASGENGFTPTSTAYNVIALAGKWFPVAKIDASNVEPTVLVSYRIEGSANTVCEGDINAHDALDLVERAADVCGFSYNISDTQYGPYLDQIGSDIAAGLSGWQYAVDYTPPQVGAADYLLEAGDDVLWYFGAFDVTLTRLTVSTTELTSGQTLTVTVESLVEGSWQPLEAATVYVGSQTHTTDAQGKVAVSPADGAHTVYAMKDGHMRTEKETIIVGDSQQNAVTLQANVTKGGTNPPPTGLSFKLDVSDLNFGDIAPGQSSTKAVTLTNNGEVAIHVESNVSGEDLFRGYLKLGSDLWRSFATQLTAGQSEAISVNLNVPADYASEGSKTGSLTFWATVGN